MKKLANKIYNYMLNNKNNLALTPIYWVTNLTNVDDAIKVIELYINEFGIDSLGIILIESDGAQ